MKIALPTRPPFSFAQTIAFVRRFPPCQGEYLVTDDSITAAVAIDGTTLPLVIRDRGQLHVEAPAGASGAICAQLVARAAHLVGADDDVAGFYAAARGDTALAPLLDELHGLHHVRFLTLEEIAVYCVFMQRTPIAQASALKRRFLAAFGHPIAVDDHVLRAMPEMAELVALGEAEIAQAINHKIKAPLVVSVVRGVAALGERFLATAPYAVARDALLEIPGIGPFSAAAILLRGLGRMDELPSFDIVADQASEVYGRGFDPAAIVARYGTRIGYWSFYLKTGASRAARAPSPRTPGSARSRARHTRTPSTARP